MSCHWTFWACFSGDSRPHGNYRDPRAKQYWLLIWLSIVIKFPSSDGKWTEPEWLTDNYWQTHNVISADIRPTSLCPLFTLDAASEMSNCGNICTLHQIPVWNVIFESDGVESLGNNNCNPISKPNNPPPGTYHNKELSAVSQLVVKLCRCSVGCVSKSMLIRVSWFGH